MTSVLYPIGYDVVDSAALVVPRPLHVQSVVHIAAMLSFSSLVQKAQTFIDTTANRRAEIDSNPSKSAYFRQQFLLPDTQHPLQEIAAELTVPPPSSPTSAELGSSAGSAVGSSDQPSKGTRYSGRLHISEHFLCFSTLVTSFTASASQTASTAFTGATHGAGSSGNGITLPLCAIRRVERLHSQNQTFTLSITTWNGTPCPAGAEPAIISNQHRLVIRLIASRASCERFCDLLKKGLRDGVNEVGKMRKVVRQCYSEYMLSSPRARGSIAKVEWENTTEKRVREPPDAGLGMIFRYPGDARKLRDRSKMRLWNEYFQDYGRNLVLIRQPTFHKLVRVGLPNRLRGETWELTSGSLYFRLQKPTLYEDILVKFKGKQSLAIDEIEKDLNRSLPEYPGFQSEEGIGRLRRVLTAYSWKNEDVGYCQAMNIVVAALLIYMSEAQAFFLLNILCDQLVPGYYSTSMYGTLLDQKVFESLVEKTMPVLWEHLVKSDVQLSVVSLPWFLSLYINSMPLVFAFRVLDVFFLEGPKVLFQVGLAILRINGEELLDVSDDGAFISILKKYFSRLDESAHPDSESEKMRQITKFQELMVVAFKEFSGITQQTVTEHRARHKDKVLNSIESFAKRTTIRNLGPDAKKLAAEELGFLYDRFYGVLYEREQRVKRQYAQNERMGMLTKRELTDKQDLDRARVGMGPSSSTLDYDGFREFLAGIARWAVTDSPSGAPRDGSNANSRNRANSVLSSSDGPEPADHDFMQRLFGDWDSSESGRLTLQNTVTGFTKIGGSRDIMSNIAYFFHLHDDDNDGRVDREGILRMSESLLFLSRRGVRGNISPADSTTELELSQSDLMGGDEKKQTSGEKFLSSVSAFIRRCFEYADPDHPQNQDLDQGPDSAPPSAKLIPDIEVDATQPSLIEPPSDFAQSRSPPPFTAATPSSISSPKKKYLQSASASLHPLSPSISSLTSPTWPDTPASRKSSANRALDPSKPLHITLPTFRMVILADETLESFFDLGLPSSFVLSTVSASASPSQSQTLRNGAATTFSGLSLSGTSGTAYRPSPVPSPGLPSPAITGLAAVKGLRGVLDNIVTDGIRVAAEVKRRMDEASAEMERQAMDQGRIPQSASYAAASGTSTVHHAPRRQAGRREEDEEDEEDYSLLGARGRDQDLLGGVEAEVESLKEDDGISGLGGAGISRVSIDTLGGETLRPDGASLRSMPSREKLRTVEFSQG